MVELLLRSPVLFRRAPTKSLSCVFGLFAGLRLPQPSVVAMQKPGLKLKVATRLQIHSGKLPTEAEKGPFQEDRNL